MKYIIIFIFILILPVSVFTQQKKQIDEKFFTLSDSLFKHIYSYSFKDAEKFYIRICDNYQYSLALSNLKSSYYWYLLTSGDTSNDYYQKCIEELKRGKENFINEKNKISDKFLLGNTIYLYALLARLEIFQKKYLKALKYLDKCSKHIKTSFVEKDQRFIFSTGLYQYYISYALRKFPFLFPVLAFYPRGDRQLGLRLLTSGINSSMLLVKTESRYFLMKIYFESEKKINQSKYWNNKLISEFPENMLFNYYKFKILIEEGNNTEAEVQFRHLLQIANNNSQLTESQKNHFINIASEDIKSYSDK